tara:strand:+ start:228213 stop:228893 length:681 start_codon:yes stop_codon:yes gene_type:complete
MIRRHVRYSAVKQRGQIKKWKGKLEGVPCFILGNGPSLNDEDISLLNPYFTIGINRAFLKLDPTILMWQDVELWYTERKKVIRLSALKVCRNTADPQNRFYHFKIQPGNFAMPKHPGCLHGFGATGPLAMQFAHSLGCNPIVMLGMDCEHRGQATNFYGINRHHRPHTMRNCSRGLKWAKKSITDRELINCSANSEWPQEKLEDVLKRIDSKWKQDRAHYVSLLTR